MKRGLQILSVLLITVVVTYTVVAGTFQYQRCGESNTIKTAFGFMMQQKTQLPSSASHHTHHMADFETVDDTCPQINQFKSDFYSIWHASSVTDLPVLQQSLHFTTPSYEVAGPPPKS